MSGMMVMEMMAMMMATMMAMFTKTMNITKVRRVMKADKAEEDV